MALATSVIFILAKVNGTVFFKNSESAKKVGIELIGESRRSPLVQSRERKDLVHEPEIAML
jgi:hypothetical protein